MSKCISKKILIFLFAAVASLCMLFPCLTLQQAKADKVERVASGYTIDSTTDIEGLIKEISDQILAYKEKLDPIVVIDKDNAALNYMASLTRDSFSYGDYEFVEGSISSDYGLSGLVGMYKIAYDFYQDYIFVDVENGEVLTAMGRSCYLVPSTDKILIEKATEALNSYKVSNFANDPAEGESSLPYKKSRATAWLKAFNDDNVNGLSYVIRQQENLNSYKDRAMTRLESVRGYYFSDKYDSEYVNAEIYQSEEDVSSEKLQEVKEEVLAIFNTKNNYDRVKQLIDEKIAEYEDLFANVKTALEREYEEISTASDKNSETHEDTLLLITRCEDAFTAFENLGTIDGYIKATDGEYHSVKIDLKSGRPEGTEISNLGDYKVALDLVTIYKSLVKRAIDESKNLLQNGYGITSEILTSSYVNYAKGLADGLTGYYGRLTPEGETAPENNGYQANQYSYSRDGEKVNVVCGSDIVVAFTDCPWYDGALVIIDRGTLQKSTALEEFKFKSTVVDSSNSAYEFTLTCIDDEGNEVNFFQPDAELSVREGALPSVERNLYLILKGDRLEEGTKGLKAEEREFLKGRVLKYYFKFTITASTIKGGKKTVLEFEPINVRITIKFNDQKEFEAIKKANACALNYYHTNVDKLYKDIEWGDNTMTFNVINFANQSETAVATTGEAPFDWAKYIVLGLVGLVALLFVLWILITIIRNWKYKVIFNANGGKYNHCIKVKLHEKFNHPTPPYRKGYKFLGWFADSKCTVRFAASELTKRHKVKVYAKWISDEEYEKLNERYIGARIAAGPGAIWIDQTMGVKKDANIEKIEIEKLSYEAKKAEEERKAEEVKLQAIREIDEAKKNDEARAKAEQEAEEAKANLEKTLAERDDLAKQIKDAQDAIVENEVDYEAAIAKAKQETEEKLRKEFDEESKARLEEQAKINEELLAKIKALEEANAKAEELKELAAKENNVAIIAADVAVELPEETPEIVEEVPANAFDVEHVFDELKAEIYSYADADDLGFGLEVSIPACAMKVVGETIELEVNLEIEDCAKKGYKVAAGEKLPVKFVLSSDDDIDEAEELIAETMLINGLNKVQKAVVTASTEETRRDGFEHGIAKERLADTAEEFYKLLRVHANSFVYADDEEVEEKLLMKMFLRRNRVYLYINYGAEGLKACDAEMATLGLKTFMTVNNIDDCKEAVRLISAMMKENGLIRYPSEKKIAEEDCVSGFTYVLSK